MLFILFLGVGSGLGVRVRVRARVRLGLRLGAGFESEWDFKVLTLISRKNALASPRYLGNKKRQIGVR